jgi:hypothetical protein
MERSHCSLRHLLAANRTRRTNCEAAHNRIDIRAISLNRVHTQKNNVWVFVREQFQAKMAQSLNLSIRDKKLPNNVREELGDI